MQKLLFSACIFLFTFLGFTSNILAQCAGNCGTSVVSNCGCDSDCWLYGDCCPDIEAACPEIRPTPPVYPSFPGGNGTVTPMACNPAASICTPGIAGPFGFDQNTPGPPQDFANPVGCSTGLFGNNYGFGFIILNITTSGNLNLLVNGNSSYGYIDVVVYNIPPGVSPCVAVASSSNEIGCNYATSAVGCTQFGTSLPCASSVPAIQVTAGQQIMVIVHDYSNASNGFTLQLGSTAGSAATGPPNATINTPQAVCVTSAPFTFTAVSNGGTWSGPGISASGVFNPAAAGVGTHTINYAVGNAPCNSASTTQVTVINAPVTAFTTNSPVCNGQTIQLTATQPAPAGATFYWTGPGGFVTTGAAPTRPNATTAMSGTYSMYMVVGNCTSATVTQNVVVNQTAPAPILVSNSPVCHGDSLILDAPGIPNTQYFWSGPNGFSSTTEDPIFPVTDYPMTGTYSLYTITNNCTSATANHPVIIEVPPKPVITPVEPICFGSTGQNLTVDRPGGTYTGTGITDAASGYFNPVIAGSGTHQIIYTIPEPCGSADTLEIIVSVPIEISGIVKNETCKDVGDGNIHISTDIASNSNPWTYLWSNGATTQNVDSIVYGNYTVVLTDQYGCQYDQSFSVFSGNSLNFSYTTNHVLCYGDLTGNIAIVPASGTPPYLYTINGTQTSSNPIINLKANIYSVIITDSRGCDTSFTTEITQPPILFADSTMQQIRLGDYTSFFPQIGGGTGNLQLLWYPNYNLSCNDCLTPMAWPEKNTKYLLQVTDENGCRVNGRVLVEVFHDGPFIPNSFTPGKDELNNIWKVSDYGVKDFELQIFDRWGSKVFESDNIYEGWDGKLQNGAYYESSVFVYKIAVRYIDGKEKMLFGNITLLR